MKENIRIGLLIVIAVFMFFNWQGCFVKNTAKKENELYEKIIDNLERDRDDRLAEKDSTIRAYQISDSIAKIKIEPINERIRQIPKRVDNLDKRQLRDESANF